MKHKCRILIEVIQTCM